MARPQNCSLSLLQPWPPFQNQKLRPSVLPKPINAVVCPMDGKLFPASCSHNTCGLVGSLWQKMEGGVSGAEVKREPQETVVGVAWSRSCTASSDSQAAIRCCCQWPQVLLAVQSELLLRTYCSSPSPAGFISPAPPPPNRHSAPTSSSSPGSLLFPGR